MGRPVTVGCTGEPWLVLPGRGPPALAHVVQHLCLHLVLAPIRWLEVLLLLFLVLLVLLLVVLPGLACCWLFPSVVVGLGRAGEESWGRETGPESQRRPSGSGAWGPGACALQGPWRLRTSQTASPELPQAASRAQQLPRSAHNILWVAKGPWHRCNS